MRRSISKKSSLLCREMVGRRIALNRDVFTSDNRKFPQGELLVVASSHRGRFALRRPAGGVVIRRVPRAWFEVLP